MIQSSFFGVSPRGPDFHRVAFQSSVGVVTTRVTVGVVVFPAKVAAFGNASRGLGLRPLEGPVWMRYVSPDTYEIYPVAALWGAVMVGIQARLVEKCKLEGGTPSFPNPLDCRE